MFQGLKALSIDIVVVLQNEHLNRLHFQMEAKIWYYVRRVLPDAYDMVPLWGGTNISLPFKIAVRAIDGKAGFVSSLYAANNLRINVE